MIFPRAVVSSTSRLSRLTKEALCAETNLPLRSLNRALAVCAEEGVLRYEKKHFRVLDEQRLLAYLPRYDRGGAGEKRILKAN